MSSLGSIKAIGTLKASQQREMLQLLRRAYVGSTVTEIPSPSLVVHADAADRNKGTLETLVRDCRRKRSESGCATTEDLSQVNTAALPLRVRPHAKLHKSRVLAERILKEPSPGRDRQVDGREDMFYSGVCVQKVSEAEFLSGYFDGEYERSNSSFSSSPVGQRPYAVRDIFISNEVGTLSAARRVSALHRWMCERNADERRAKEGASFQPYRLSVCVDSLASVDLLLLALGEGERKEAVVEGSCADPLPVFVEVNIGQNRGGAKVSEESLQPIVERIIGSRSVCLEGLHAYHGGAQHIRDPQQRASVMHESMCLTSTAKDIIERVASSVFGRSFRLNTVTGAGTGTFAVAEASSPISVYTELQPGSYYVMDRDYLANRAITLSDVRHGEEKATEGGAVTELASLLSRGEEGRVGRGLFEPAMYIKASVISKTVDDASSPCRVIIDSGHKSSAIDSGLPCLAPWQARRLVGEDAADWSRDYLVECINGGDDHMGFAAELCKFVRCGGQSMPEEVLPESIASEEARRSIGRALLANLSVGDPMWLIPGHCDPTFNLHDYFFIVRGDSVDTGVIEDVALVDARGCQQ